jgi:hypothetical protein
MKIALVLDRYLDHRPSIACRAVMKSVTKSASLGGNPDTLQATAMRSGINPTSLAYNFNSSTLVSTNTASRSISVVDFIGRRHPIGFAARYLARTVSL